MKLISYRSRSRNEIIRDLHDKGFSPHIAETAATELSEKGWLDDGRLAIDTVAQCQRANKGRSRVYAELRKRGIARELAEESMREYFDCEKENEAARQLFSRSIADCARPPTDADIERAARRLSSRGFSPAAVANALHEVINGSAMPGEQEFS